MKKYLNSLVASIILSFLLTPAVLQASPYTSIKKSIDVPIHYVSDSGDNKTLDKKDEDLSSAEKKERKKAWDALYEEHKEDFEGSYKKVLPENRIERRKARGAMREIVKENTGGCEGCCNKP